jgi:hypothetical protein
MTEKVIKIETEKFGMNAELNDTLTARKIWESLPIKGIANIWGDEIFFKIPISLAQSSDARQDVEVGELAYGSSSQAFCIFFGPTPVSIDQRPRSLNPVNVIGTLLGDATQFKKIKDGDVISIVDVSKSNV